MELPAIGTPAQGNRLRTPPHLRQSSALLEPVSPDRLITFAWHPGDVPRGIVADIIDDLGISRDDFYFKRF